MICRLDVGGSHGIHLSRGLHPHHPVHPDLLLYARPLEERQPEGGRRGGLCELGLWDFPIWSIYVVVGSSTRSSPWHAPFQVNDRPGPFGCDPIMWYSSCHCFKDIQGGHALGYCNVSPSICPSSLQNCFGPLL